VQEATRREGLGVHRGGPPSRHSSNGARPDLAGDGPSGCPGRAGRPDARTARERRPALLAVADALPVTVLAVIAGAGSFTHIRGTAAQHGPIAWATAVCMDLRHGCPRTTARQAARTSSAPPKAARRLPHTRPDASCAAVQGPARGRAGCAAEADGASRRPVASREDWIVYCKGKRRGFTSTRSSPPSGSPSGSERCGPGSERGGGLAHDGLLATERECQAGNNEGQEKDRQNALPAASETGDFSLADVERFGSA